MNSLEDLKQDTLTKIDENIEILEELQKIDKVFKNVEELKVKYFRLKKQVEYIADLNSICNINTPPNKITEKILKPKPKTKLPKNRKQQEEDSFNLREKFKNNYRSIRNNITDLEIYQYNIEKEDYKDIREFIVRKLFIYYMMYLVEIIKHNEKDELKALTFNILKDVDAMKEDDSWILADNDIKSYLIKNGIDINQKENKSINELINEKDKILQCIYGLGNDIRFIVKIQNETNIKSKLENDNDLIKMVNNMDDILFELIDFYEGKNKIQPYFNNLEEINRIFGLLNFKYKGFKSCEEYGDYADKLDLGLCETLDVVEISGDDDILKDFLIRKVYKDAILKDDKVIKKALVSVYRVTL